MDTDTIPARQQLAVDATVPDTPIINPVGLAARWGVDKKTILGGIHRKEIPCTQVGRRWLIPMAWVEAREQADAAAGGAA